jgi:Fe-S-cluster containining protein
MADFSTMSDPCKDCGLCCEHLLVEAYAADVLREPRIEDKYPLGKRHVSLPILEACWVLSAPGKPCAFLTKKKRCSIYPTRPQVCVAFLPGSPKCQDLRRKHGMVPVVLQPSTHRVLTEIIEAAIAAENADHGEVV